jgi:hypothetical protein
MVSLESSFLHIVVVGPNIYKFSAAAAPAAYLVASGRSACPGS